MVKIRLKRLGQKKAPFYRIVVADERSPRNGRNIDEIGTYDPNQEPAVVKVDEEAAKTNRYSSSFVQRGRYCKIMRS